MTPLRKAELERNPDAKLTAQELAQGWHFCMDWDGMVVHPDEPEGESCTCESPHIDRNRHGNKQGE